MVLNGDTFSTKASSMQVANTPKRAIDSSGYRFAMYIYIFASNNLFQSTNWNPVNQI